MKHDLAILILAVMFFPAVKAGCAKMFVACMFGNIRDAKTIHKNKP
jgi:hypothetical protein